MEERGLQPERTALSWFRTTVGFAGVAALTVRESPSGARTVVALVVVAIAFAGVVATATIRSRQLRTARQIDGAAPPLAATLMSGVTALAVLALMLR